MDGFLNESSRVHAQNSAQNRDYSENPRWGPYKITKMSRKIYELEAIAEKQ